MLNNYFTIRAVSGEAAPLLIGGEITEVYTQERNRLTFTVEKSNRRHGVLISCEPRMNYFFTRESMHRAKRNTFDLLSELPGRKILDIALHPSDRQLSFTLDDGTLILMQLFGPHANVLHTSREGNVIDAFLRPQELRGAVAPAPKVHPPLPDRFEEFTATVFAAENMTVADSIRSSYPVLGAVLIRDLLLRAGVDGDMPVTKAGEEIRSLVWDAYIELLDELHDPSPRIYFENDEPAAVSIVHLRQYFGRPERPFGTCTEAVRVFTSMTLRRKNIDSQKKDLQKRLETELRKTERSLRAIRKEIDADERSDEYEKFGTILMAHPDTRTKGVKSIELPDITLDNRPLRIGVDPFLNVIQNAEKYFTRARKARQSRTESVRREKALLEREGNLRKLTDELSAIDDQRLFNSFFGNNRKLFSLIGIHMKKDTKEEIPFRVFTVAGGFEVWAGKNSANNDLLTMKYAKPHDLWFHARGAGGSHVVLRTGGSRTGVPKEAVMQTASIAAYYSKMKGSKLVSVTMADRKYVRKRKGDPPGTVVVAREKTIMAEPRLPDRTEKND